MPGLDSCLRPRRCSAGVAAAVLLLHAASAVATQPEAAAPGLSLAQAQEQALARNPDLAAAAAALEFAAAQVRIAHEFPNPALGLSVGHINTDRRGNATSAGNRLLDRSYDSIASLTQLIELGKRGIRQESARLGQRAAEAQRDDARRLMRQSVTQAYIAAVEADSEVQVLEASATALRHEANIAATRLRAGDISTADEAQIQIAATRLALDADAARQTARTAVITLEALLGMPAPRGETPLTDSLAEVSRIEDEQPLEDTPPEARPDVAAAQAAADKAEADLRLQRRGRIPDLTVSAEFEHNPPDLPNSAGFGVSLPVPLWNRNTGEIRAARATREQAQAALDKLRIQAAAEIAAARAAFVAARARVQSYNGELLPKSAAVVKTITFAYEKGGASLLDLLSTQRNDNDVRLAAARAQADYADARIALATALNRHRTAAP